eukprot:9780890-Ditylum_brightwellii.AAC.1
MDDIPDIINNQQDSLSDNDSPCNSQGSALPIHPDTVSAQHEHDSVELITPQHYSNLSDGVSQQEQSNEFNSISQSQQTVHTDASKSSEFSRKSTSISNDKIMPLHTTLCESNLPLNLLGACDSSLGNFKQTKESKKRQWLDDLPATSAISGCTPNAMKGSGWSAPTVPFQRDWDNLAELLTDDTQPKSSSFHFGQTSEQFPKNVSSSRSVRDRDCPFHDMARRFLKTEECHTAPHYRSEKDRCNVNGLLQNENISPSMWALSTTAVTPDSKLSALQQSASFAQSLHRKHPNELMDESNTAIPSKSLTVDNKIDDDFLALAESLLSKPSQEGNEAKKYDRFKFKCETKQTIFAETSTRQQSNTQSNSDI